MKKVNFGKVMMAATAVAMLVSCSKSAEKTGSVAGAETVSLQTMIAENGANSDETGIAEQLAGSATVSARYGSNHFLYTESNEADLNRILIYRIKNDGSLEYQGATASGGAGTGAGLGSQSAVTLDKDHEWLFAVNAGSNTVSSFKVHHDGSLTLAQTEHTDGQMPNSVTVSGNLLYVLNHGTDNIHGYKLGADGKLEHIEGSTQALSATATDAPQISFTPNGDWLIVTEKATNHISSFRVKHNGAAGAGIVTNSTGETPFGFDFARDHVMVVADAGGGAAGAGAATSYYAGDNGKPHAINGAVANSQGAPCWTAITEYGRFAYITNAGSNTISSYYVSAGGRLYLVDKAAAGTGTGPTDIAVATNNYNVYALTAKSNTINEYHRVLFGGLKTIGAVSGVPISATGMATY